MRAAILHELSRCMFVVAIVAATTMGTTSAWASGDTETDTFQRRYLGLKTTTTAWLTGHQAVADGNLPSRDRTMLLQLRHEVLNFCFDVKKYVHTLQIGASANTVISDGPQLIGLTYACDAMEQMLEVEFDAQRLGANRAMLRQIQTKYQELWELADQTTMPPAASFGMTATTLTAGHP